VIFILFYFWFILFYFYFYFTSILIRQEFGWSWCEVWGKHYSIWLEWLRKTTKVPLDFMEIRTGYLWHKSPGTGSLFHSTKSTVHAVCVSRKHGPLISDFSPIPPSPAGKETWWQLASRCCWNRARPWHASEPVSFLVGLRTYQHHVIIHVIHLLLRLNGEQRFKYSIFLLSLSLSLYKHGILNGF